VREFAHIPVLLDEVISNLVDADDKTFVDATIGGGGHGFHILEKYRSLKLIGIDADEDALAVAAERLSPFRDRMQLRKGNFRDLKTILYRESISEIDSVLFDLGISMYQMTGERGFSYSDEGSLDMRMDREQELTAYDVVNRYDYRNLTRIIEEYGEEGDAPRLARAIMEARKRKPIDSARELSTVIERVRKRRGKIHPATRIFQAIRIEVNRELENIEKGLEDAADVVRAGGKIGVISFHSLEDRLVKNFFRTDQRLGVITKKPLRPGREELRKNRRARSAKLRIAEKL
jgi:16S rRNA (cytosine1402-N4)-methyltransferase